MQTPLPAEAARDQFGRQAELYAVSAPHSSGESLEMIAGYAALRHYGLAVDLGTGTGFTAFAVAPYADHVLATDIAAPMLAQARRLAGERGLANVAFALAEAEGLPFASGSLDAVASRTAAHHFHDLAQAAREIQRVLRPGGVFLLSDTVAPESDAVDAWMNDVEMRRDTSHQRNLKPSQWRILLEALGLTITHQALTLTHLEFDDWVRRSATPAEEVERLRRDVLAAPAEVKEAFGIRQEAEATHFHWDNLVVRAVKG